MYTYFKRKQTEKPLPCSTYPLQGSKQYMLQNWYLLALYLSSVKKSQCCIFLLVIFICIFVCQLENCNRSVTALWSDSKQMQSSKSSLGFQKSPLRCRICCLVTQAMLFYRLFFTVKMYNKENIVYHHLSFQPVNASSPSVNEQMAISKWH